jgi:hypothetical protein
MSTAVERLVDALLYEGYALYPYTPTSQKNATPTPFGIVYPPAYAAGNPHLYDRLQVECLLADDDAPRRRASAAASTSTSRRCGAGSP